MRAELVARSRAIKAAAADYDPRITAAAEAVGMTPDDLIDLCHEHNRKVRNAVRSNTPPARFGDRR